MFLNSENQYVSMPISNLKHLSDIYRRWRHDMLNFPKLFASLWEAPVMKLSVRMGNKQHWFSVWFCILSTPTLILCPDHYLKCNNARKQCVLVKMIFPIVRRAHLTLGKILTSQKNIISRIVCVVTLSLVMSFLI